MSEGNERARVVGFTPGAAVGAVAAVFVAYRLRNAFVAAHQIVGWVIACSIVALLIDPLVAVLERRLPRWLSVIAVVFGGVGLFGGVIVALVHEIVRSIDELEVAAPKAAQGLEDRYRWAVDVGVVDRVNSLVTRLDLSVHDLTVGRALGTAPTYLVTGILMLFLLAYGRRYVYGTIGLLDEVEQRSAARAVVKQAASRGRGYILATLAHAALNGVVFGLVCWAFNLPAPLSLGVAVGAFTVFPLVGVIVGSVPALLLAFGSQSWRVGLLVLVGVIALQFVEAIGVRPYLDARTVRLGPTIPLVVALIAFELYGVGGAVYAIALAVLGLAALDAVGRWQGEDIDDESSASGETDEQLEPA